MARRRGKSALGSFGALEEGSKRPVVEVAREVSDRLRQRGVPHALVGGLAVGAHGWERYTKDVDVLVPSTRRDVLRTAARSTLYRLDIMRAPLRGIRFYRHGVAVDTMQPLPSGKFLDAELVLPAAGEAPPVIGLPALVYMKLASNRAKDRADVVELLKAGRDAGVREYLDAHAPELIGRFDEWAAEAAAEGRK